MEAFLISVSCSFVATQSDEDPGFTLGLHHTRAHATAAVFRFGFHLDFDGYYELWTTFAFLAGYGFLNMFIVGRLDDIDIMCFDNEVLIENALGGVPSVAMSLRQRVAELLGLMRIVRHHLQEHNAHRVLEYKLGYPLEGVHDSASFGANVIVDSPSTLQPRPLADNAVLKRVHDQLRAVNIATDTGMCFVAAFAAGMCCKPTPPDNKGILVGTVKAVYQQTVASTFISEAEQMHLSLIANVQNQLKAGLS
jgi:hypothetical protein